MAEQIGISRQHIVKNLAKLQQMNWLKRIGSDRSGKWFLLDSSDVDMYVGNSAVLEAIDGR